LKINIQFLSFEKTDIQNVSAFCFLTGHKGLYHEMIKTSLTRNWTL